MTRDTEVEAALVAKWATMGPLLDERERRLWAATTIPTGRAELAQG